MKKQVFATLSLVLIFSIVVNAKQKAMSLKYEKSSSDEMSFPGWIDFEQDQTTGIKKAKLGTDIDLDTSAINQTELTRIAAEKVIVKGGFFKNGEGKLVFKVSSVSQAPNINNSGQEDSSMDTIETLDSESNDNAHN